MVGEKTIIEKQVEPSVPICQYCGCLTTKPCQTEKESWRCPNNQIDFEADLPDDFDPNLN